MKISWRKSLAVLAAVATVVLCGPAAMVNADSSGSGGGCSATAFTPYAGSGNGVTYRGTASCSTSLNRTFNVTLMHAYDFFPDYAVHNSSNNKFARSYSAGATICDNGGVTTYYTKLTLRRASDSVVLVTIPNSGENEFAHC